MRHSLNTPTRKLLAAAALTGLLALTAASSATALATEPEPNGTVTIHASTTPPDDPREDTHVCEFRIVARNFGTVPHLSWHIDQQPPTGHERVSSGALTLTNGTGQSEIMTLPPGHYKMTSTFPGQPAAAGNSKLFWSTCATTTPKPQEPEETCPPTTSPPPITPENGETLSPGSPPASELESETLPPASPPISGTTGAAPLTSTSPCASVSELPHTGTAVGPWFALAGAVITAGGALIRRTRTSTRHR